MKTDLTELSAIEGNTYPVKDALKAIGAKWDSYDKCWRIADAKLDRANAIVAAGPTSLTPAAASAPAPASRTTFSIRTCRKCPAKAGDGTGYFRVRIGRNGLCTQCNIDAREDRMGY